MNPPSAFVSYFVLQFLSETSGFVERFAYEDPAPKCCCQDEILVKSPLSLVNYDCADDRSKMKQVFINSSLKNDVGCRLVNNRPCIDVFSDRILRQRSVQKIGFNESMPTYLNLTHFPKCCPVNFVFDLQEHGCVSDESGPEMFRSQLNDRVFLVQPGLSNCSTIADYEVPVLNESLFNENMDLYMDELNRNVSYGSYCVDKIYNSDNYVARICFPGLDICKRNMLNDTRLRCIKKCCPDGKSYKVGQKCTYNFQHGLNFVNDSKVVNSDEPFHVVHGHHCRIYMAPPDWNYTLDEMGSVTSVGANYTLSPFDSLSYCFEYVGFGKRKGQQLFLCQPENNITTSIKTNRIALLFSCLFLVLTLIGYSIMSEMQNVHGKTRMCHCSSLLVAYVILTIIKFFPDIVKGYLCTFLGYFMMYSFLATFMWYNVMCFDIWWKFGSIRNQDINYKRKDKKRFILYSLYAWIVPAIITTVTFCVQYFGRYLPKSMQPLVPTVGHYSCFFETASNTVAHLVWFIFPLVVISICNLVLFIKAIKYYYKVKLNLEKMMDTKTSTNEKRKMLTADKEKLKFSLKLFLVMGLSWIFEALSACVTAAKANGAVKVIFIIFDVFNGLQGVFIFCIFILNPKFIHGLKDKIGTYLRRVR